MSPQVRPTSLAEVRDLGCIPLVHANKPNAAGVVDCGRTKAFELAHRGEIPTIRVGNRLMVPVPELLRMLGADSGGDAHVSAEAETG
jgi:hypothetical protein